MYDLLDGRRGPVALRPLDEGVQRTAAGRLVADGVGVGRRRVSSLAAGDLLAEVNVGPIVAHARPVEQLTHKSDNPINNYVKNKKKYEPKEYFIVKN
jgi:hypothetical protein